jgi:hypothetical protein
LAPCSGTARWVPWACRALRCRSSGSFEPGSTGAALENGASRSRPPQGGRRVREAEQRRALGASVGALVGAVVAGNKPGVARASARPAEEHPAGDARRPAAYGHGGFPEFRARIRRGRGERRLLGWRGKKLKLEINDTGGAQGLVALASWANVEEQKEWQGGYEKTYKDGGRIVHERWDSSSKTGEYGVIVGQRFMVGVSGSARQHRRVEGAHGSINVAALEAAAAAQRAAPNG